MDSPTNPNPDPRPHDAPSARAAAPGIGPHPLARGGTIELPPRPGLVVACMQGLLWLRQQGDADDHLLRAGQFFHAQGSGPVVMQALLDAQFRVDAA